jgi:hypothetical protein
MYCGLKQIDRPEKLNLFVGRAPKKSALCAACQLKFGDAWKARARRILTQLVGVFEEETGEYESQLISSNFSVVQPKSRHDGIKIRTVNGAAETKVNARSIFSCECM